MYRLLLAVTDWLQNTPMALAVGGSDWAYPFIQLTHFTGLSLWIATSVAVDLRLLGVNKGNQTASQLLDALFVWNWIGFGIAVAGGFLLFSIAATSFVGNAGFRVKLGILLPLALASHIVVQRKTRAWSQTPDPPVAAKLAGLIELLLWLSVATAAVSIPYF
jgi:hypothetical protein